MTKKVKKPLTKKTKVWILVAALSVFLAAAVTAGALLIFGNQNPADPKVRWYSEEESEFVITTADQLFELAYLSTKYDFEGQTIKLGADIVINDGDASTWGTTPPSRLWYPIENFNGTFDGQGHSISGLYGVSFNDEMGLFTNTGKRSKILNLRVVNSYIKSTGNHGTGFIASNGGGTFENIYVDGTIYSDGWNNGGIIGCVDLSADTVITNCWFAGEMILISDQGRVAGGIVGDIMPESGVTTISHCLSTGKFSAEAITHTGRGRLMDIGGIVGRASSGTTNITDCFSNTDIDSGCLIGAGVFIGSSGKSKTNLTHNFAIAKEGLTTVGYRYGATVGDVYTYAPEYVTGFEAYSWTTLDFENYWAVDEDGTPILKTFADKVPSLSGVKRMIDTSWYTKRNTATLKTIEQVRGFHVVSQWDNFSGKTIYLGADIVVQEGDASTWGETAPEVVWKSFSNANVMFAGTFDGLGHSISGMYQKAAANGLGMFTACTDGATIRNLKVLNSYFETNNVAVNNQTYSYIGSVAAYARGTTFDSIYSDAYMASDGYYCGGIVGLMRNGKANVVTNCWYDGVITLTGVNTGMRGGGIVGAVWNVQLNMSHCLMTGQVTGESWAWGANEGLMVAYPTTKAVVIIEDSLCAGRFLVLDGKKDGNGMMVGRIAADASITFDDVYAIRTPDPEADPNAEAQWLCDWGLTGYRGAPVTCDGPAIILEKELLTGYKAYQYTGLDFKNFWAVDPEGHPVLQTFMGEDEEAPDLSNYSKVADYSWYTSAKDTYYLSNRAQLIGFSLLSTGDTFKDKTVCLANSITVNYGDAANWDTYAPTYEWIPVGNADNMFQGTFNGQGYTISGIYVSEPDNGLGLFGMIKNATIKNLRLTNSFVESTMCTETLKNGKLTNYNYIGSIAAYAAKSTFTNVYSSAIVKNDGDYTGGILGMANTKDNPVTFNSCWFDGTLIQAAAAKRSDGSYGACYTGGMVGLVRNTNATINHCLSTATMASPNMPEDTWGTVAGGMIGRTDFTGTNPAPSVTISDSLANITWEMPVSTQGGNGNVISQANPGTNLKLNNVYAVSNGWKGIATNRCSEKGGSSEGEAAMVAATNITGAKAYINANLDYNNYWTALEGKTPQPKYFASGTVAEKLVIDTSWYDETQTELVINTADELIGFASLSKTETFEGKTIKLGADIVLNEGDASTWGETAPSKFWISIGSAASRFKGTFDGQGHTISGIYYQNEGGDGTAMFECIDGATIKNFKLVNSYFDDSKETDGTLTASKVAAIVGTAYSGTVSDIYTDAYVSGGSMYNGGIVGQFYGSGNTAAVTLTISNCWFDGNLDLGATGRSSGGIIGGVVESNKDFTTLNITNCLMTGVIDSQLVGEIDADINRQKLTSIGGLMGSVINSKVCLKDILVAGEMNLAEGATYCGSLLGYKNWGVAEGPSEDIFILKGLYDQTHYSNPDNAHNNITSWPVSVKEEEMLTDGQARHTASGFDFENVWIAVKDALPELRTFSTAEEAPITENADPTVETTTWFDGTQTEYIITTVGQMKGFMTLSQTNDFSGVTIKLGADIAMNDGDAATWGTSAPSEAWKFIGSATNPFKGTFDGQGYTLSGVYYMSTVGSTYVGLFMEVENATIKNLILDNSALHTTSGSGGNGLLVGRANGVTIENVMVTDSVYGSKSTYSGIVAYAQTANAVTFKNVWMAGNLSTEMWTTKYGGLLGGVANVNGLVITVENCLFTGKIEQKHATSAAANTVGGFVGELASDVKISVKNSLSAGTITTQPGATIYAGSVVGNSSWRGAAYTTYENVYATKDCYSVGTYRQPSEYTGTIKLVDQEDILGGLARWTLSGLDFSETGAWIAVEDAIPELRYFSDAEEAPEVENPADGPVVLDKITVTAPTKTTYDLGESLVTDGMVVKAEFSDNSEEELTSDKYTVTGFDSSAVGTVTVTVTYEGKTATFEVKIVDIPDDPNEETTYWYDGTKTEYVLNTLGEFKGFVTLSQTNTFAGITVKLGADMVWNEGNAADWATTAPANAWTPIGNWDNGFTGVFDGQGHTVSGLYYKGGSYASFIARMYGASAKLLNVRIVNSYFESDGSADTFHNGAGIVGRATNGYTVSGVYTDAYFKGVKSMGLVAFSDAGVTNISNCWNNGTMDASALTRMGTDPGVGGMVGVVANNQTHNITNCLVTATFTGALNDGEYLGGIFGMAAWGAKVMATDCLVAADMSGVTGGVVGSIAGNNPGGNGSVYTDVYATSETHANLKGAGGATFPVTAVAKADILGAAATAKLTGFDFTNTWTTVENDVPVLKIFAEPGEGGGDEPIVDPNEETTEWFDGSKTEYTLTTFGEFKGFVTLAKTNDFAGITIRLDTDVTYGDGAWSAAKANWTPIGTKDLPFAGTFDGLGHTVSGLLTKKDTGGYHGMFGVISGATIKNLRIENSTFHPQSRATYFAGSVAAYATNSTIYNVYSNAVLYAAEWIGGIVAHVDGTIDMDNCWFDGTIYSWNASTTAVQRHGGIIGRITADGSTIDNCLFTGTVDGVYGYTSDDSNSYVGGIVGMINYNKSVRIANCLSAGSFAAANPAAGVQIGSVIGSGSAKPVTGGNNFATTECYSVMITGRPENLTGMATQVAQATILGDAAKTVMTGFDFENIWEAIEGETPVLRLNVTYVPDTEPDEPDEPDVDPTVETTEWYDGTLNEYTISTIGELKGLVTLSETNTFSGKTIKLDADIVWNEGNAADWATTAPANVWTPAFATNTFAGIFDGQGHTISGLYAKSEAGKPAAFFHHVYGGTVKNLSVTNSYFESMTATTGVLDDTADFHSVAAVIGRIGLAAKIENIYSNAILVGGRHAGLIGFQDHNSDGPTIKGCWFDGSIAVISSTSDEGFGGILGGARNSKTTVLENCLFTGTITAAAGLTGNSIGGLVGTGPFSAIVMMTNCLSAGDLTGAASGNVGSVIGNNPGSNKSVYTNVFATTESHANLAGANGNKTSFATVAAVAKADILGNLATAKLTGFDFTNTWMTVEGKTPVLKYFTAEEDAPDNEDTSAVDTSWYNDTDTTFTLTTAGQLKGLVELSKTNTFAGKTIKLGADIVINEGDATAWVDVAPAYNWSPIGGASTFNGTFDGQGHTISGLYCAHASGNSMGMFREVQGTVTNFKLVNSYLANTVDSGYGYNGVIASYLTDGTISKVYTDAIIATVDSYAGGIVGVANGANATISECQFAGTLKARCSIDAGCNASTENPGNVRAHARFVGGIVGAVTATNCTVSDCIFSGRIMNEDLHAHRTSGIIGGVASDGTKTYNVTVLRCFSIGKLGTMNHEGNSYHFNMIMDCRGLHNEQGVEQKTQPTNVATLFTDNYLLTTPAYKEDGTTTINAGGNITGASGSEAGSTIRYTEVAMIDKIAADKAAGTCNLDFENVWTYNEGALPTLTAFAD